MLFSSVSTAYAEGKDLLTMFYEIHCPNRSLSIRNDITAFLGRAIVAEIMHPL